MLIVKRTPLHDAAKNGEIEKIKELVRLGADVNAKSDDYLGATPLRFASEGGHVEAIKELVRLGADVNANNGGRYSPLHFASREGSVDAIKELVRLGADVNIKTEDGHTPLHDASIRGHVDAIRELVRLGADVNIKTEDGHTPLYLASIRGHVDAIRELVRLGADIETPFSYTTDTYKIEGLTLLFMVIDVEVIRELVKMGANIEAKVTVKGINMTPLAFLLSDEINWGEEKHKAVRELIKLGASTYNIEFRHDYLIDLMATDIMDLEEKHVDDYLKEDPMNMVILDGNNPLFTNVDGLSSHMEDSVVFACKTVGDYDSKNVEHTKELFNPRKLGFVSGYIENSSMRDAMRLTVLENRRIFRLSDSIRKIPAVVSQLVYEGRTGEISANHCQAGADGDVRIISEVNSFNIPVVPILENQVTGADLSMLVISRTIEKHSTASSTLSITIKEQITNAWEAISDTVFTDRFEGNITVGALQILPDTDMHMLQKMCRIFNPSIHSVSVKKKNIQDFSFLGDIVNLGRFSSSERVNDRSVFQYLQLHKDTLEVLSIPVHRDMMDLSTFTKLEKIHIRDFDHYSGVIESIGKAPSVSQIDLESSEFDGSLDGLIPSRRTLRKLTVKFARFKQSIAPIGSLSNLIELKMHLPIFDGSLSGLSKLGNLTSLRLTTSSPAKINTSAMNLKTLCIDQPE